MRREYAIIAPHMTAKGGIYEPRESPYLHHPCHRLCRTALLLLVLSGLRLYRLSLAPSADPPPARRRCDGAAAHPARHRVGGGDPPLSPARPRPPIRPFTLCCPVPAAFRHGAAEHRAGTPADASSHRDGSAAGDGELPRQAAQRRRGAPARVALLPACRRRQNHGLRHHHLRFLLPPEGRKDDQTLACGALSVWITRACPEPL